MSYLNKTKLSLISALALLSFGFSSQLQASCEDKLFSIKAEKGTRISELIDQLADQCDLTLIVKDKEAKKRLKIRLDRFSLRDVTLPEVLNVALNEHNLNYSLDGNILKISYLLTKTFHVDYIGTDRSSNSNTHVMLASGVATQQQNYNSNGQNGMISTSNMNRGESESGIEIKSTDEFRFWSKLSDQIENILNRPEDNYQAGAPVIDKESGLVTITGTKKQLDRVENYLHNLINRLHKQVLIDVKMYAVVLRKGKETGIDWREIYKLQNFTVTGEQLHTKNVGEITFPQVTNNPYISKFGPGTSKFTDIVMNAQLGTILKFLETQGDVHSVSNPKVLTLNNQAAMITVGKQYFYKIQNSTTLSNTGGSTVAQNEIIDSVFAGILLDITPEIAADGTITLKINPSVSDTVTPVSNDNVNRTMPPDLERRQMASVVTVKDGAHVILGGLITDRIQNETNKVPILGNIPILGYAFKYDEKTDEKIELVIIVTPHLVKAKNSMTLKDLGYDKLSDSNMTKMR